MTFKEWYRAYNPEIDMDCDINLDELLSCWYAAYEEGYNAGWEDGSSIHIHRKGALDKLAKMGQDFDEDMSKVGDKDYKC